MFQFGHPVPPMWITQLCQAINQHFLRFRIRARRFEGRKNV